MRLIAATALLTLSSLPAIAADWKSDYKVVRFGVLSGENEKDRVARYKPFEAYLEKTLGVDVELFTAGNYDGVVQALAADQIEFAFLGSSAYAAAYTETKGGVEPLLTAQQEDGSTGYYSVVTVRCDSPYKKIEDLKGKVLAFADPDSTSGYAVPNYNLVQQGFEPSTYFSKSPSPAAMKPASRAWSTGSSMPLPPISTTRRAAFPSAWSPRACSRLVKSAGSGRRRKSHPARSRPARTCRLS